MTNSQALTTEYWNSDSSPEDLMILTAKLITDCYNQGNHVCEDECKWDILVSMVKLVQEGNLVASKKPDHPILFRCVQ